MNSIEDAIEDAIEEREGRAIIRLEVQPSSKKVEIGYNEWRKAVTVKIKSPARGGKANRELLDLLKSIFGSEVRILRGEKSTSKVVEVEMPKKEVVMKLREWRGQY